MRNTKVIVNLLLAAGASSRMRELKQLIDFKGESLINYTLGRLMKVESIRTFVVLGNEYKRISNQLPDGIDVIINPNWNLGLSTSIVKGVQALDENHINWDYLLITLADQPLIKYSHINSLLNLSMLNTEKIGATGYQEKPGVPAIFPKKYKPDLMVLEGDKGARDLLKKYKEEIILIDGGQQIEDLDTPADYQRVLRHFQ